MIFKLLKLFAKLKFLYDSPDDSVDVRVTHKVHSLGLLDTFASVVDDAHMILHMASNPKSVNDLGNETFPDIVLSSSWGL